MPVPREVHDWIARSEVDHVGPFVNAWAAFNAWYRHVCGSMKDRDGLDHVRTKPNAVRGAIRPLLEANTPDAIELKTMIAGLHGALEAFLLEYVDQDGETEHVSFRSVPLNRRLQPPQISSSRNITYCVTWGKTKPWESVVTNQAGNEIARIEQDEYDEAGILKHSDYLKLSETQQAKLRALYADCNPRPTVDLINGGEPPMRIGSIDFRCSTDDLFGGIIETIYRMRNLLLHGQLKPDPQALACYAPAYHILRRMLQECR